MRILFNHAYSLLIMVKLYLYSILYSRPDIGVNLERSLIYCLQLYEHCYEFSFYQRLVESALMLLRFRKQGRLVEFSL